MAGNQARSLVETHLRARGINNLEIYEVGAEQTLMALLDEAGQLASAKQWAVDNGFRFAITGNVQEWQYKNGLDNEPSVGLTLKFIDLQSDQVMWVASASRTGWGYQNLSSVGSKTIGDLLSEVRFKNRSKNRNSRLAAILPTRPTPLPTLPNTPPTLTEPPIGAALAEPTEPPVGAALAEPTEPAIGAALPKPDNTTPTASHSDLKKRLLELPPLYETSPRETTGR